MNLIIDTVNTHLPNRRKATPSGWISFNAVCCHHNGEKTDTRQRGGVMINDGVSYHCFNCGFKASWQPGRKIGTKFRKLLQWLNVSSDLINKCALEALRIEEIDNYQSQRLEQINFIDKQLPRGAESIKNFLDNIPNELVPVLEYIQERNLYLEDYNFCWTPEEGFNNRLIVPFYYQEKLVGYTARKVSNGKPKYISEQQPGYVFNIDHQHDDRKYVIVCEGPFDAISIDGVAVLSNEVSDQQRKQIDQLQKQVVVVPDRDQAGIKLVEQAIDYGWAVSFPEWQDCKDVNDSNCKYGRLSTLWMILNRIEINELKIRLSSRAWFKSTKDNND